MNRVTTNQTQQGVTPEAGCFGKGRRRRMRTRVLFGIALGCLTLPMLAWTARAQNPATGYTVPYWSSNRSPYGMGWYQGPTTSYPWTPSYYYPGRATDYSPDMTATPYRGFATYPSGYA